MQRWGAVAVDLDGTLIIGTTARRYLAGWIGHWDEVTELERRRSAGEIDSCEVAAAEAAHYAGRTLGEVLGRKGLARLGKPAWREAVKETATALMAAFVTDHLVLGGGNAKLVRELPPGARIGNNLTAFRGGFRLWNVEDVKTLSADGAPHAPTPDPEDWRLL